MSIGTLYEVITIGEREESAKCLANLAKKYKAPVAKKVTLNERFGVVEKGFALHSVAPKSSEEASPVQLVVLDRHFSTKRAFVEKYAAKHNIDLVAAKAQRSEPIEPEDKENGPKIAKILNQKSSASSSDDVDNKNEFSVDAYISAVSRQILNPVVV